MKVVRHKSAREFLDRAGAWLEQAEIENNLILGIASYLGTVVSRAGFERERPRGVAISWVFTPSHLRGRGYATSCVAALTQRMFDAGKRFCCLYADLANPTSTSIYRKIGYREICEVQHWVFE
jgi:predicted GNAT family acetyltransferase